jgi:hypothetical protein
MMVVLRKMIKEVTRVQNGLTAQFLAIVLCILFSPSKIAHVRIYTIDTSSIDLMHQGDFKFNLSIFC